jgi:hypothetical protein
MKRNFGVFFAVGVVSFGAALAGCRSTSPTPVVAPAAAAPSVGYDAIVGRWGLASYRNETDRARTITEARAQCNKPYIIEKGHGGGVMMNLADDPKPQELVLKGGAGGKTYIGPPGDAGGLSDREIISSDKDGFVVKFVDPEVATRYGTMVYTRCAAK